MFTPYVVNIQTDDAGNPVSWENDYTMSSLGRAARDSIHGSNAKGKDKKLSKKIMRKREKNAWKRGMSNGR